MTEITSFKAMIEKVVRDSFQNAINEELGRMEQEIILKIERLFELKRNEAKKLANTMAVELLQKVDIKGYSFELKL
jgi:hypothetical protein